MVAAAVTGPSPGCGPGDSPEGQEGEAHRAHRMLKLYKGLSEGEAVGLPAGPDPLDPTDLNGAHFDPEVYLDKLPRDGRIETNMAVTLPFPHHVVLPLSSLC
uniref:Uncharacterized protein n=1 Tax=Pan paniscus TaxID=9597 RepID=A0A2R9B738_PANPA